MEINKIYNMDCLEGLKQLDSGSVDLIVTDPPYGISFMGKNWDKAVPSLEIWQECRRVLKSGAFMFVMSIPRMDCQFEMAKRLKLAQFEIGFTPIYWVCASGFPKAMNISKKVDDFFGIEREIVETTGGFHKGSEGNLHFNGEGKQKSNEAITKQAQELDGSYAGFQPKPAVEVIMVAMKPLSKENYIKQALDNGKGITWLDNGRIPYESEQDAIKNTLELTRFKESFERATKEKRENSNSNFLHSSVEYKPTNLKIKSKDYEEGKLTFKGDSTGQNNFAQYLVDKRGRFPANLLVSDDVLNDGKITKGLYRPNLVGKDYKTKNIFFSGGLFKEDNALYDDEGSFSRYFSLDNWWQERVKKLPEEVRKVFPFLIVPKASSGEKQEGLNAFESNRSDTQNLVGQSTWIQKHLKNIHPTVKPLDLMSYLVTLGSREDDVVLDPFIGSGTTAIACRLLNRRFIGFEINKEYHKIAEARLKDSMQQKKLSEISC